MDGVAFSLPSVSVCVLFSFLLQCSRVPPTWLECDSWPRPLILALLMMVVNRWEVKGHAYLCCRDVTWCFSMFHASLLWWWRSQSELISPRSMWKLKRWKKQGESTRRVKKQKQQWRKDLSRRSFILKLRPTINLQTLPGTAAESFFSSFEIASAAPLSPGVSTAVIFRTVMVNDTDTSPARAPVILRYPFINNKLLQV